MPGTIYPGFTADEPTSAGRAIVTALDAAAQRSLLGFDFIPASDSAVVHLAGAETVTGQKTFNQPLRIATPTVAGGDLWMGVVENGVDKFGYRDVDDGDLYIAAKSPLSRALRVIPSDSVSGDVAFRSNGSVYAFRNYLGNYATVQASAIDNPTAPLTLGNETYGAAVAGALTAGAAAFSGQVTIGGALSLWNPYNPSWAYAAVYSSVGITAAYADFHITNNWSRVFVNGATGVSISSNGNATWVGGPLLLANNQPLQWIHGSNAYSIMFMDVNGDMQVTRTLQFQAQMLVDRISNRSSDMVVGPEGSQHLFLRANGTNRLSIYSDGSSTFGGSVASPLLVAVPPGYGAANAVNSIRMSVDNVDDAYVVAGKYASGPGPNLTFISKQFIVRTGSASHWQPGYGNDVERLRISSSGEATFSGDVSAGRTTLTGPAWPVDWAATPILKVKLGAGIYKAQTWVDSSDVEFAHVLYNGKFQGKAYELTGNVQVSSGMYLDSASNQLRLAAWSGLRVEYINGTVVPLVLDHLGNLSVTGTLRPGYPASASSISSSDANILDLNAWHGIRVNFGNGAGTPFSINYLGAATFSGDVGIGTAPSYGLHVAAAKTARFDGYVNFAGQTHWVNDGYLQFNGSAQIRHLSTFTILGPDAGNSLTFDASRNATFGGTVTAPKYQLNNANAFMDSPTTNSVRLFGYGDFTLQCQSSASNIYFAAGAITQQTIYGTGGVRIENPISYDTVPTLTISGRGTQVAPLFAVKNASEVVVAQISSSGTASFSGRIDLGSFPNNSLAINDPSTNSGVDNIFIGATLSYPAMTRTGYYNTCVGGRYTYGAGAGITSGGMNTCFGSGAGAAISTQSGNTHFGYLTGGTGSYNTSLGWLAGFQSAGDGNIHIGYMTGYQSTESGKLRIGNGGNAPTIYGDLNGRRVVIGSGTDDGVNSLQVAGSVSCSNSLVVSAGQTDSTPAILDLMSWGNNGWWRLSSNFNSGLQDFAIVSMNSSYAPLLARSSTQTVELGGTVKVSSGNLLVNGTVSSPSVGNGTGERFGASSLAAQYSVAIGNNCNLSGSEAAVAIGHYAGGGYRSVSAGFYAAAGWQGVAIGGGSSTQSIFGIGGVAIGNSTYAHEGSIALGSNAVTTAANQFVIGNTGTRWTMPAVGQRNSEVGNGSGSWQTGYREEFNSSGIRCGFYSATPVARQQIDSASSTLAADLLLALNNLGLIQSL